MCFPNQSKPLNSRNLLHVNLCTTYEHSGLKVALIRPPTASLCATMPPFSKGDLMTVSLSLSSPSQRNPRCGVIEMGSLVSDNEETMELLNLNKAPSNLV